MDKEEYVNNLKYKIEKWKTDLSILQDDTERGDEDLKEEYLALMGDLFRNFEEIESRLDEFDLMEEDVFKEEREVLDRQIYEFDEQLKAAREKIKDV